MFVKKFLAGSLEDALKLVKKEFGESALILSSVTHKGNLLKKGQVEVTAAQEKPARAVEVQATATVVDKDVRSQLQRVLRKQLSTRLNSQSDISPRQSPRSELQSGQSPSSGALQARSPARESRYIDIEPPPNAARIRVKKTSVNTFEEGFLRIGLTKESARELSNCLVMDYPKNELEHPVTLEKHKMRMMSHELRTVSAEFLLSQKNFIAMGPPGSGKTSFLVKLGLELRERGVNIALASRDRRKVIGAGEMAQYAKILKVPFAYDLREKKRDRCTLVDLSAISYRTRNFRDDMERILSTLERASPILVLDATQRHEELMQSVEHTHRYSPVAVAFTKVDLSVNLGVIYEFLKKSRLPLLSISVSDSFRSALRFFGQLDLAALILSGGLRTSIGNGN